MLQSSNREAEASEIDLAPFAKYVETQHEEKNSGTQEHRSSDLLDPAVSLQTL